MTSKESLAREVKDLSDKTESSILALNGQVETLSVSVHQHGQEFPRKLSCLNSEVEIHSDEVCLIFYFNWIFLLYPA